MLLDACVRCSKYEALLLRDRARRPTSIRLKVSRLVDESQDNGDDGDGGTSGSTELHRLKLAAPVLSMDFCPASAAIFGGGGGAKGLLLAGGMDGGSHLISVDGSGSSGSSSNGSRNDNVDGDEKGGSGDDGGSGAELTGKKNGVALLASMKNHAKYVVVCRCVFSLAAPLISRVPSPSTLSLPRL